jgi:hypothetical protein
MLRNRSRWSLEKRALKSRTPHLCMNSVTPYERNPKSIWKDPALCVSGTSSCLSLCMLTRLQDSTEVAIEPSIFLS